MRSALPIIPALALALSVPALAAAPPHTQLWVMIETCASALSSEGPPHAPSGVGPSSTRTSPVNVPRKNPPGPDRSIGPPPSLPPSPPDGIVPHPHSATSTSPQIVSRIPPPLAPECNNRG